MGACGQGPFRDKIFNLRLEQKAFERTMKIFLSSTHEDLIEYRASVLGALSRCERLFKGMEVFGASEKTPLDYCLEQINHCELVICVLGVRYGTRPPQSEKSYTH